MVAHHNINIVHQLRILFNHSDSAAVNNITLNMPTKWMAMWLLVISKNNEEEELPVVSEAGSKQDLYIVTLAAKLKRVGIKDKVNARMC